MSKRSLGLNDKTEYFLKDFISYVCEKHSWIGLETSLLNSYLKFQTSFSRSLIIHLTEFILCSSDKREQPPDTEEKCLGPDASHRRRSHCS